MLKTAIGIVGTVVIIVAIGIVFARFLRWGDEHDRRYFDRVVASCRAMGGAPVVAPLINGDGRWSLEKCELPR